jgi:hypothetical protein
MASEQCKVTMQGFADKIATSVEKLDYAKCINTIAEQSIIEQCKDITDPNTFLTFLDSEPLAFGLIFAAIAIVAFTIGKLVKQQNNET